MIMINLVFPRAPMFFFCLCLPSTLFGGTFCHLGRPTINLSNHVHVMWLTRPQSSLKVLEIELEKLLKNLKQKFKTNVKVKAIPRASEI
jgi:hypothetical protein